MPFGEILLGAIGEFIGYIVVDVIIEGLGKLIRTIYYGCRKLITGKDRDIPELKRIEKRYLYKKIKLKSDLNKLILKGTYGTVVEIIDQQYVSVQFENIIGKSIMDGNKQSFKIDRKIVILDRKKRSQKNK